MSVALTDRPLPVFIADLLDSAPQTGIHKWIFRVACALKPWRSDDEAVRIIAEATKRCRRHVPDREIIDAVRLATNEWQPQTNRAGNPPSAPAQPQPHRPRVLKEYNAEALRAYAARCRTNPTLELLREISWVSLPPENDQAATTRLFLETCFSPGDKVLIFTNHRSQGDYGYIVGRGCWRLGKHPGEARVPCELPTGGVDGVWFLNNPVTGRWSNNDFDRLSRRSWQNVTRWQHLVIESDEAPTSEWLKALLILRLPITGIYTSGGRSVHALLRFDSGTREELDAVAAELKPRLGPIGADCAALTSVRLTRLPGAMRGANTPKLQRLLWLTDSPPVKSIAADLNPF
jgi:hypothetical protein